jgi:hypothetical protein
VPGAVGLESADFAGAVPGHCGEKFAAAVDDPQRGAAEFDGDDAPGVRQADVDALAGGSLARIDRVSQYVAIMPNPPRNIAGLTFTLSISVTDALGVHPVRAVITTANRKTGSTANRRISRAASATSVGSGARIGMEQAKASAANSDEASVAAQAPYGVVTLRSGYGLGPANGATMAPTALRPATLRTQRGPRPDTAPTRMQRVRAMVRLPAAGGAGAA